MPYTGERRRSRHPFELFMLIATLVYSVNGVFVHSTRPGSIEDALGGVGTELWSLALFSGTLLALAGIAWPNKANGLTTESIGLLISGAATLLYGFAVLVMLGPVAGFAAAIIFGYGSACSWRAHQIRKFLKTMAREQNGTRGD